MSLLRKRKAKTRVTGRKKRSKGRILPLRWLRYLVLIFAGSTVGSVLILAFVPVPVTPLMVIRCAEQWSAGEKMHLRKDWRPLKRISPHLADAVVASEDQLFFQHSGFDWESIRSAFAVNRHKKRKLGASTITQQTAKNLFLWPTRSWTRKALEAYFTVLLEVFWSKRRVLEVYLNIIETGDGIYGAEAAARAYYQKPAADLDKGQAALLAAILPNPRAWTPSAPTPYLLRRQTWILRQMGYPPVPLEAPAPDSTLGLPGPGPTPVTPAPVPAPLPRDSQAGDVPFPDSPSGEPLPAGDSAEDGFISPNQTDR